MNKKVRTFSILRVFFELLLGSRAAASAAAAAMMKLTAFAGRAKGENQKKDDFRPLSQKMPVKSLYVKCLPPWNKMGV